MTRTPYALEPAPVGVPELMMLSFNNGLPPATSTPVAGAGAGDRHVFDRAVDRCGDHAADGRGAATDATK
ncbi:MAG: hypothetical protein V9G13_10725 [Marmoricola sp.]